MLPLFDRLTPCPELWNAAWAVSDFPFLGILKWQREKESILRKEQARDSDVMILAISAGLGRKMVGQWDRGKAEIFMRSSCWGEASRPPQCYSSSQPHNSSIITTQSPDKARQETLTAPSAYSVIKLVQLQHQSFANYHLMFICKNNIWSSTSSKSSTTKPDRLTDIIVLVDILLHLHCIAP